MSDKTDFSNLQEIDSRGEVKFVITDRNDYEWSKDVIEKFSLIDKCGLLISPAFGFIRPATLARWMIDDRINARLNVQLHKYIFDSPKRGV
jgi:7-carboxy-7-deazaguanine synthase